MFLFWAYFAVASGVLIGGSVLYYVFFPDVAAERFGAPESLPTDVGIWRCDLDSPEAAEAGQVGLAREVRSFYEETGAAFRGARLLRQVRYRSVETGAVVSVEPDKVIKPRRQLPT